MPGQKDGDVPRALMPGASHAYVSEYVSEFADGVVILDDCAGDSWKIAVGNGCQQEASSYTDCDGDNVRARSKKMSRCSGVVVVPLSGFEPFSHPPSPVGNAFSHPPSPVGNEVGKAGVSWGRQPKLSP